MNQNVFGYLLVPQQRLEEYAVIARDYWQSTVGMNEENHRKETHYSCCVVCMNSSWWQRRKLSSRTGIPMCRIVNVRAVNFHNKERYLDFATIIAVDSMVDDSFWGRTKIYASEEEISRKEINPCIDIVYAY